MKLKYDPHQSVSASPLAVFRILFGLVMFISIVRFWSYGWISKFYLEPHYFFSYYGFDWVQPLGQFTYVVFAICGLSALAVSIGWKYRSSIIIFFLSWTYIELMDKTTYLNHYYFISLLSFLMIFLPAASHYSIDTWRDGSKAYTKIPRWCTDAIKLLLSIVYFYAGLAKLQRDWMVDAMPLKMWLPSKYDTPLLGDLMQENWIHYAFSWGGAAYDLLIPFLLWMRKTRPVAFVMVIIFHVLTRVLFPIGMFPYIMIVSALIFFDAPIHDKILRTISRILNISSSSRAPRSLDSKKSVFYRWKNAILISFFVIQLLFPFRYLLYPGNVFWHEQGFRFSWRVMLMEKAGYAQFKIVDGRSGRSFLVDNTDFLTAQQEKMMNTQPDMILQYAHFLKNKFAADGHQNIEIYVESYVALNGRPSQPFVDPNIDLLSIESDWGSRDYLLPMKE